MSDHLPKESVGDELHRGARAALSAIPFVGGAAVELFNRVLAPPIQRRRDAWLNVLAERIAKMEQEGRINVKELQNNDEFVSTVMQASQVAIRNHQQEKLDALRNAVLNTAIGQSPNDSKREMFLGFVDTFTVHHLRILKAIATSDADEQHRKKIATSINDITELAVQLLPDLRGSGQLAEVAIEDLCHRGLLFWNRDGGVAIIEKGTTQVSQFGDEFLHFISEPKGGES